MQYCLATAYTFLSVCICRWEWLTSLKCEWLFISTPKMYRWPFTFYFLNRYCALSAAVGLTVALNVTGEINCQVLYIFNLYMGNLSIGLASINLCLRTIEVWSRNRYIVWPLVAVILGHLSLLLQDVRLETAWAPGLGCVVGIPKHNLLLITFAYTTCFDFVLFLVAGWGFASSPSPGTRSHVIKILFDDGLVFFSFAFLASLVATVLVSLSLQQVVLAIVNVPLAIICTTAASRVVRKAAKEKAEGPEMFTFRVSGDRITIRSSVASSVDRPKFMIPPDGVHVQVCRQVD